MRQNAIRIAGSVALLLGLFGTDGPAAAAEVTTCSGGTFVVDAANAADVSTRGYKNANCDLVITATLPSGVMDPTLNLVAKSVTIGAAGAGHVDIINHATNSDVRITAEDGNIRLLNASLKAHKNMVILCKDPAPPKDCTFESDQSEIIVTETPGFLPPLGGGGVLHITSNGPLDIQTTKVHAGDTFHLTSVFANVTFICAGGSGGVCKDPNQAPIPDIIKALCGDPIQFPCPPANSPPLVFQNAAELKSVCFPDVPGEPCNGGGKQKDIFAGTFIDITGTSLTSHKHLNFRCGTDFIGPGATLAVDQDKIDIQCGGKVDITNATLTAKFIVNVESSSKATKYAGGPAGCVGVAAGQPCIDATGATVTGSSVIFKAQTVTNDDGIVKVCDGTYTSSGSKFPILNGIQGVLNTSYGDNVRDTDAECGGPGTGGIFCRDGGASCFGPLP